MESSNQTIVLEVCEAALGLQLGVEARLPREAYKEEPERGPRELLPLHRSSKRAESGL